MKIIKEAFEDILYCINDAQLELQHMEEYPHIQKIMYEEFLLELSTQINNAKCLVEEVIDNI